MQVSRIEGQQRLVNVVGPQLGAGLLDNPRHAPVVIGVPVGDDNPFDVRRLQPAQRHARPQHFKGRLGAGVNQRQPLVLKDVGPGRSGMGMALLGDRHRVDPASVAVSQAQGHPIPGGIAVAEYIHLREVVGHPLFLL